MGFDPADHRARFRSDWFFWLTVTCSCGWVDDRRQSRRKSRESYYAHVILTAYEKRHRRIIRDKAMSVDQREAR